MRITPKYKAGNVEHEEAAVKLPENEIKARETARKSLTRRVLRRSSVTHVTKFFRAIKIR